MELHLGKITNKELAEWFGISESSFKNKKTDKLKQLAQYAKFYEDRGKVYITEIIKPTYSKDEVYQKTKNKINDTWSQDGLDSCTRVGGQIYNDFIMEDPGFDYAEGTIVKYTAKGRNELYGNPKFEGREVGTLGTCQYIWCKKDRITGGYVLLNEEEEKIKDELQMKYFGNVADNTTILFGLYHAGKISKMELADRLVNDNPMADKGNFMRFMIEFKQRLGGEQPVQATLVERSAFYLEDKRE